jgi:hypothetical protein
MQVTVSIFKHPTACSKPLLMKPTGHMLMRTQARKVCELAAAPGAPCRPSPGRASAGSQSRSLGQRCSSRRGRSRPSPAQHQQQQQQQQQDYGHVHSAELDE